MKLTEMYEKRDKTTCDLKASRDCFHSYLVQLAAFFFAHSRSGSFPIQFEEN